MLIKTKEGINILTNPDSKLISYVAKNGKHIDVDGIRIRCLSLEDVNISQYIKRDKSNLITLSIICPKKAVKLSTQRNYVKRRILNKLIDLLIRGKADNSFAGIAFVVVVRV